jgi:prepilin-type N-terminal cleavage/methylation domain-containing protein
MKSGQSSRGFTLLETLVVVVLIGIVALAAVPLLSSQNPTKLDVAAAEVGNALRFAIGESDRIGGCVWVDGTVSGHLQVYSSPGCASSGWATANDPLTKRALDLDTSGPAFSGQVSMAVRFFVPGNSTPYPQLLITPWTPLRVYDGATPTPLLVGPLGPGSGVVLTLGPQSVAVAINEITGLVTLP